MNRARKLLVALLTAIMLFAPMALPAEAQGGVQTYGCPCPRFP